MDQRYDYIIIGSGFGGSVSAMRLSEKGYRVLVIEKGKRYEAEDFPKTSWNMKKYFWMPALRCFGFQKLNFFRKAFILSGVGVGGGSLGYANTHYYPPDTFFENPVWSGFKDWKKVLDPFFEKARYMLGTTTNSVFDREDDILKEVANDFGKETTYKAVDVGVYFGEAGEDVDPYFEDAGPKRNACTECAGCMVGCRYNAKNTLDKNYLYFAEKNGVEILAETKAEKIECKNGVYSVHVRNSTGFFNPKKRVLKAKGIVFSGGVLGTLDLLLKQKYLYKTLPDISPRLGDNVRTNSESLCGVTSRKEKLNHGIAISSTFEADDHTHVEVVKYSDGSNVMKLLATLATGPGHSLIRIGKMFGNIIRQPFKLSHTVFSSKWATRSIILLVMQTLDNSMKVVFKRFPFPRISIENKSQKKVPAYIETGQRVMHAYAKKTDGIAQNAITEVLFNLPTTAHIIGGCPMGKSKEEGVVNDRMEVFGYPNMYVVDGSIIPCNLGVNPSLTITALSEYVMGMVEGK